MTMDNEMVMVAGGEVVPVELSFTCAECKRLCHVGVRKAEDNTRCGWCWRQEQDRLAGNVDDDAGNYESDDYNDDFYAGSIHEDPAVAYERERGEAWQDRYDMWRREY